MQPNDNHKSACKPEVTNIFSHALVRGFAGKCHLGVTVARLTSIDQLQPIRGIQRAHPKPGDYAQNPSPYCNSTWTPHLWGVIYLQLTFCFDVTKSNDLLHIIHRNDFVRCSLCKQCRPYPMPTKTMTRRLPLCGDMREIPSHHT